MVKLRWGVCLALLAIAPAVAASSACTASKPSTAGGGEGAAGGTTTGEGNGSGTTQTGTGGTGGIFDGGLGGGGSDGGPPSCEEDTKLMYLVTLDKQLYKFNPSTLMLLPVGPLNCPGVGIAAPFGMAVDRLGVAWILYDNGSLFKVKTSDASCEPTGILPGQQGFSTYGMGFVTDQPGGETESLYLTQADVFGGGTKLGKMDTNTLIISVVGEYDDLKVAADATGTGDAKLFGFFRTMPVTIAEIDKTNAHIIAKANPSVNIGSAWAFAAWGGFFWLFTAAPGAQFSRLDKFEMATGITTPVSDTVGFKVVGAGVSTCAPTKPPE